MVKRTQPNNAMANAMAQAQQQQAAQAQPQQPVAAATPAPQQPQGQQNMQQTQRQSMFNPFASAMGNLASGAMGIDAPALVREIDQYIKDNSIDQKNSPWTYEIVVEPELPKGACVLACLNTPDAVYVHPIVFGDKGGRSLQEPVQYGVQTMVESIQVSDAFICSTPAFEAVVKNYFNRSRGAKMNNCEVLFAGVTVYLDSEKIEVNNLLANASNEVMAAYSAKTGMVNPDSISLISEKGSELVVDMTGDSEKVDLYGRPVFAPLVLSAQWRKKSQFNAAYTVGSNQNHYNAPQAQFNVPFGEVAGYMELAPLAQQMRDSMRLQQQQGIRPMGDIPLYAGFFQITNISWGSAGSKTPTLENILAELMFLPSIGDSGNWVSRVVNARNAGFNPMYDFATAGYDERGPQDPREAFEACHSITEFDANEQQRFAREIVTALKVRIDLPKSGPSAGILNSLADPAKLNQAFQNLTGLQSSFQGAGVNMGLVPMGTYEFQGKKRDYREVMNYFSWGKYVGGNRDRMAEYLHTWMTPVQSPEHSQELYRKRVAMVMEITDGTFELTDQALRLEVNLDVVNALHSAATSNGIQINSARRAAVYNTAVYGYQGDINNGLQMQQPTMMGTVGTMYTGGNGYFG